MPSQKSPGGRREEILVKARALFVRHGFQKTTVEDIARACSLGKTALYYYFKSKEEIFEQVVRQESSHFVLQIREAVAAESDPVEKVRVFIVTRFAVIEEFLVLHQVSIQAAKELAPLAEVARQEFFREEIDLLMSILVEGKEAGVFALQRPELLAASLISACVGVERQFMEVEGAPPAAEGMEELLNVLLHGLCHKPENTPAS